MKKSISFLLVFVTILSVLTVAPVTTDAAVVNTCYSYTLGEEVEYAYTSMNEYHKFEIEKRARVKVEMCIPEEQESTYKGSVEFYFARKEDGDVGPMSKPMEFWTAPKPKVKIKSNTLKKASWKKVKGVTGYLATEGCIRFVGYNLFGQELRDSITAAKLVKGTKYKKKYYSVSKSNKKSKSSLKVTTYSKHGKYYYVSGRLITKNKDDLEILKVDRIVG